MKPLPSLLALVLLAAAPLAQRTRQVPELEAPAHVFDAAVVVLGPLDPAIDHLLDLDGAGPREALGTRIEPWNRPSRINLMTLGTDGMPTPFWEGTFQTHGSLPRVVSQIGDLNGDGLEDFAVLADEGLWTWTSNGMAAPTAHGETPVPVNPYVDVIDLVLGDFNGDGRQDPAVLDEEELHVWTSAADGTPQELVSISYEPSSMIVSGKYMLTGDFHADGDDELVLSDGRDLTFFDFVAGVPVQGAVVRVGNAYLASGLNYGDVDGDGDGDIVVWNDQPYSYLGGTHRVLEQTSPGTYAWATSGFVRGGAATDLIDVDGDGDLDGACCGGGGGWTPPPRPNDGATNFQIAVNDGEGNFAVNFRIPGLGARQLAGVMDVNADGRLDLVAGRAVYFAKAPLNDDPIPTYQGFELGYFADASHVDYDGDGDLDFALDLADGVLEGNGNGTRTRVVPTVMGAPAGSPSYAFLGDWDGDGDVDQIGTIYANGVTSQHLVENLGGGAFVWGPLARTPNEPMPRWSYQYAWDADGDGDLDLITSQNGASSGGISYGIAYLYWNDGAGYFTGGEWITQDVGGFADLNGDGREDVLVSIEDQQIGWLENLGYGNFGPVTWFPGINAWHSDATRITTVDMDRDGDIDVWGTLDTTSFVFLQNDGYGNFTPFADLLPAPDPNFHHSGTLFELRVLDIDGDGELDVIRFPGTGALNSGILYLGHGGGVFTELDELVFGGRMPHDVDADGDIDLVGRSIHENRTRRPPAHSSVRQYGTGTPGLAGLVPKLGCRGPLRPGVGPPLLVTNGRGNAFGILACSPFPGEFPDSPYPGVTSYLNLEAGSTTCRTFRLSGLAGEAGTGSFEIPAQAALELAGRRFQVQVFLVDPAAPGGYSATNALQMRFGRLLE